MMRSVLPSSSATARSSVDDLKVPSSLRTLATKKLGGDPQVFALSVYG
jgi:hypothetical protein